MNVLRFVTLLTVFLGFGCGTNSGNIDNHSDSKLFSTDSAETPSTDNENETDTVAGDKTTDKVIIGADTDTHITIPDSDIADTSPIIDTNTSIRDTGSDSNGETITDPDTDIHLDAGEAEPNIWVNETPDPTEIPTSIPTVEIQISDEDLLALNDAPFYGDDVLGTFTDDEGNIFTNVDINFRGAYALMNLIQGDPVGRRNWKVKFSKENMYHHRREWNFNFEPHLRQKLAMDLMKFSGVKVPDAQHVLLLVNGEPQGIYLQYEDPDNKDWLYDKFGNDEGDLYKAATDMPKSEGEPEMKYFADTTYLGEQDADYHYHYRKKTNHKNPETAEDYSVIRLFLDELNHTLDDDFLSWIESRFNADSFLSYLVISNFISNWDSFPQRPKNFWLFENRKTGRIEYIPWDMDATFEIGGRLYNQMGPETPIMFNLKTMDYDPIHEEEGLERPLAFRIMNHPEFESAYLERYRILFDSILSKDYLLARVDALDALVAPHLSDTLTSEGRFGDTTEREDYDLALEMMRDYIAERTASVSAQLAK